MADSINIVAAQQKNGGSKYGEIPEKQPHFTILHCQESKILAEK